MTAPSSEEFGPTLDRGRKTTDVDTEEGMPRGAASGNALPQPAKAPVVAASVPLRRRPSWLAPALIGLALGAGVTVFALTGGLDDPVPAPADDDTSVTQVSPPTTPPTNR